MRTHDRRRVTIASAFTVVALLALIFFDSGAKSDKAAESRATAPPTTKYVPETPTFIGGDDQPVAPGVINVHVPPAPSATSFRGRASYFRYVEAVDRACTVLTAAEGAPIKVTNINNGQETTCTNTLIIPLPDGVDIVIHTDVFSEIADITDAPISVRVSW
ncbi:MAG: hypothetical protein Q7V57_18185 [Actinomycetota bacterium]|nr:hypothetical protein [Actinomycetota bacterium]